MMGKAQFVFVSGRATAATLFLLFFLSSRMHASAPWPNSPAGEEGEAMVAAINTLDATKITSFASMHLDSSATPADKSAFPVLLNNVARRSHGITVEGVYPQTESYLGGYLRTKTGNRKLFFRIEVGADTPHRIVRFEIVPQPAEIGTDWKAKVSKTSNLETRLSAIGGAADTDGRSGKFSGVLMIAKGEETVLTRVFGMANRETATPNTPATRFDIASVGKLFTAIAVAQQVAQSRIDLHRPIAAYVPDYPNPVVSRVVTTRELLSHTSGMGDIFGPKYREYRDNLATLEDYYPIFASDRLQFKPGEGWSYSNAGFLMTGVVLERVSKEKFPKYLHNHLFGPAHADDCVYARLDEIVSHRATGYYADDGHDPLNPEGPTWKSNVLLAPVNSSPAGGEFCSGEALVHLGQALLVDKLVDRSTLSKFTEPAALPKNEYGLGFESMLVNGERVIGHSGDGPGVNTAFYVIPSRREVVVLLTNQSPPFANQFANQILDVLTQ